LKTGNDLLDLMTILLFVLLAVTLRAANATDLFGEPIKVTCIGVDLKGFDCTTDTGTSSAIQKVSQND
jgi:hypothetical protein